MSATSLKRPFRLSKRNRERSKKSAECGKICIECISSLARVMTRWIGQSTLTSTRIATDADLASESDSEFLGTWQQKPRKKYSKKTLDNTTSRWYTIVTKNKGGSKNEARILERSGTA